jgi:hypothetical protein
MVCETKGSFDDAKDVTYSKWKIIAWNVNTSEPKCVCPKCDYFKKSKSIK